MRATVRNGGFRQKRLKILISRHPHQFRTRNNLIETQRTRSRSNKSTVKSTKLIDILPLITVWLQVRVLPGPPRFALRASRGTAAWRSKGRSVSGVAGAQRKRRRTGRRERVTAPEPICFVSNRSLITPVNLSPHVPPDHDSDAGQAFFSTGRVGEALEDFISRDRAVDDDMTDMDPLLGAFFRHPWAMREEARTLTGQSSRISFAPGAT